MAIADRKRRAFEARERLVIEEADLLLLKGGYLGLNLDELADRVEYSKATLYHHFTSKEDLILAVVVRHLSIRNDYFSRAAGFDGFTRERMFAFSIADWILSRQFPHSFPLLQLVRTPSIWKKCSESRQLSLENSESRCFQLATAVAMEAQEYGELPGGPEIPAQIVWGLISLSKGAHLLETDGSMVPQQTASGPLEHLFANYHSLLDGAGWIPRKVDHDHEASRARIEEMLFSDEISSLE